MELLCFPLQGHPRGVGFNTPMASTGAVRTIQRHDEMAELCRTEGAAVDELVLVDDSSTDPCRKTRGTQWSRHHLRPEAALWQCPFAREVPASLDG